MKKRTKRFFIYFSVIFTVVVFIGLFVGLIYYNMTESGSVVTVKRDKLTAKMYFYDADGKAVLASTLQTTVQPSGKSATSGVFYMSFRIYASNIGNVVLNNIRLQESHPNELTQALQNQSPSQSSLATGQSNILLYDTANDCTGDAQCSTNEKCVGSPLKCRIDVSNYNGNITFGATILANYKSAQGSQQSINATINLPIVFSQDEVILRTTAVSGSYGVSGVQIAVDRESDGTLEAYTYSTSGSGAYYPVDFLSYTPQNNLVYKCGTSTQICVSQLTNLDKTVTQGSVSNYKYILGGTLIVTKTPTEPYLSQNCGGSKPCQERYSALVTVPTSQCNNNIIEGTELCDGTQLANNTCVSIGQGFTGGVLACSSTCDTWVTSGCNGTSAQTIKFRTTDTGYYANGAVGYSSVCGNDLTGYGYVSCTYCSGTGVTGTSCMSATSGYTKIMDIPGTLGTWSNGLGNNVSLFSKNSDTTVMVVCGFKNGKYAYATFDSEDSDSSKVDAAPTSINIANEVACTP